MSLNYTPVTQSILHLTFMMCVATIHRFNYNGQKSIQKTKKKSVYNSDIAVTLK